MEHIDHEQDRSVASGLVSLDANGLIVIEDLEWFIPGVSFFTNLRTTTNYFAEVGFWWGLNNGEDGENVWELPLNSHSVPYDGSDLRAKIFISIDSAPGGDEVDWAVNYKFHELGKSLREVGASGVITMDVSSWNADELHEFDLILMSGVVGASLLGLSVARLGTTDSYNGDVSAWGMIVEKV